MAKREKQKMRDLKGHERDKKDNGTCQGSQRFFLYSVLKV